LSTIITRLSPPLLLLVALQLGSADAQQPNRLPSLGLGDAVVTGFSGTIASDPNKRRPPGKSAIDLSFIDPEGPSARIIAIGRPGHVWDGRLLTAPKTFDVLAKDVGQVFGVALDDASPPNIYLAATSAFGLNIVGRGRNGVIERRKKGGPGAGWMKGQFGLDLQGGPGAIYKVDGRTGVVALFANVTLDGVPNPAPALGNLAYDSAHKQLFVSDLYTGMIHRFDLDGKELGRYDHGVTGLGAAKLDTAAFDPANRPNIGSEQFDTQRPDSWGFAPPVRRVWGLAVHDRRLYYSARNGSVGNGPQIWSVGIAQDGSFAADPRWEIDVPAKPGPYPVSDIAFSQAGAMILAQRAPIAAAYDYSAFTKQGEPRVLRYSLESPDDPNTPSRWVPAPEEYAIGFAVDYRNGNGGVALGYGYDADGALQPTACEAALWSTGQNLRSNPALRARLEPGGPLLVQGLQGSPADLVRSANAPPWTSYFVDYDDKFDDARASGHMGSVRIFAQPCAASATARPAAGIAGTPGIVTPIGCVGPNCRIFCTPTCVCPPGTVLEGKECVKQECPDGQVFNPATGACGCPRGTVLAGRECVPIEKKRVISCRPPLIFDPTSGNCVPRPRECPLPLVLGPADTCICPQGTVMQDDKCVPQICPSPLVPGPCTCPEGTVQDGMLCVPPPKCPPPQIMNQRGECVCPEPMAPGAVPGTCMCPDGEVLVDGKCVPPPKPCPPPQVMNVDGICECPAPMVPGAVPDTCICPQGSALVNGKCVTVKRRIHKTQPEPKRHPKPKRERHRARECPEGKVMVHGHCVMPERKSRDNDRIPEFRIPGSGGRGSPNSQGGGSGGAPGRR